MAQIDDIGNQPDAVPLLAFPQITASRSSLSASVSNGGTRGENFGTCSATPDGGLPAIVAADEHEDSASMIEAMRVDLPWEDTPEKRYPLPDPAMFTEHEKRYPPDRYGEELGPNARVFKIYHDRVTEKDEDLVQGWHETLNVLLVFAGLFSAVLTAFLIESTKQLQPDYTKATAVAVLAVLAQLQGTNSSASASVNATFAPDTDARWINGLWFTSLMLALIVSLLAILVKQWLVQYTSLMRSSAGNAKRWACRHFALRNGLSTWGIEPFISWLAVLLHIALFLFFAGLVTFLRGLDPVIFYVMIAMSAATASFYLASTVAPIIWTPCPSRTPLLRSLETGLDWLQYRIRTLLTVAWNVTLYLVAIARAVFESFIVHQSREVSWNVRWWLGQYHRSWRREPPTRSTTTFESRLMVGREHQLIDEVILWVLGPENQLTEVDAVVGIDAIGAVNFENHEPQQLSLFRSAHILSAVDRQYQLLTRAGQAITAERAASIGRVLRVWIAISGPVDRDAANRLGDLRVVQTHDVPILADELISRCSDDDFKPPEWLSRDVIVKLAIQSAASPRWAALFGGTTLAIYSKHKGRDASLIKAITESSTNAILVIYCLCAPEDVTKALSRLPDAGGRFETILRMLPNYLKAPSTSRAWRQHLTSIFFWAFCNSGTLGLVSDDAQALRYAYWRVFCQSSRTPKLDIGLLPFVTSPDFVQSCDISEIYSALDLICELRGQNVGDRAWSGGLEEVMFHLLERRAALSSHRAPLGTCNFWPNVDSHDFVVKSLDGTLSIDNFLQETSLNVLRQRPASGGTTTSTWRLYLSASNISTDQDALSGWIFANELALLSRVGLEASRAKALLHELAGDDRGIQLMLGNTNYFVRLALHARTIDFQWWISIKRRILDLPLLIWDTRNWKRQHSSQQAVVDQIESDPPCKQCAEAEPKLRQILGFQPL
ncbi:hypothetical protein BKA62DRAFT_833940 [Auriculariales sp. MPI-PUGE-AT-0066]|nr:hypothetical protein BKA62DRAFT_833940 [Auriculariales sp. MPI-PUGE-AT-0066]